MKADRQAEYCFPKLTRIKPINITLRMCTETIAKEALFLQVEFKPVDGGPHLEFKKPESSYTRKKPNFAVI